jgi:hypothetical protein
MAAGLALVSSILMAGKPPIRTDYWQELSRAPLLLPNRDCRPFRLCRLSRGRSKAPCRINSLVFPFVRTRRYITNKPLPYIRNATISLYSITIGGAYLYTLYRFLVLEYYIKRRS